MNSMNSEGRICRNCGRGFQIDPADLDFYRQIGVPAPTWCPECRAARRMVWRNERTYYKRKCNAPGHTEDVISLHPADIPYTVYDQKYWWSDAWDPMQYGKEYDFSKPFFEQYAELLHRVPLIALSNTNSVNSEYCSSAAWNKNCHLVSAGGWNENVMYANRMVKDKDSLDLYIVDGSELCYDDSYVSGSYRLLYSSNCEGCSDSWFLYNCKNCRDCIGCANLRNKQYCIFNEQISKDEYEKRVKELNLGSRKALEEVRRKFQDEVYVKAIHKYADIVNSVGSTGDHLQNTKNCRDCFDFVGDNTEDCRYVNWSGFGSKGIYDCGPGAGWKSELLYEGVDINSSSRIVGGVVVYDSSDVWWSVHTHGSHNMFGCYGMRNKEYCILNKQYSEEEYEELLPKIKKHMDEMPYVDKRGVRYGFGEFFPPEIALFAYNETVAEEYFPSTKEKATAMGYQWRDPETRNYGITLKPTDLPDTIRIVSDDVVKETIGCAHEGKCEEQCTEAFRITPEELAFYKKMNIPLPTLCPNCRHYGRLKKRTPMKLWHRGCMCDNQSHGHSRKCSKEFETSYAPEKPEIVYCEECYQKEIV